MRRYLIGEVCAALGVKPHVLRYWEHQIGILSPAKNRAGRRVYTPADLQTLFRVKYLVQHRLFTLEGAAQRILEESGGRSADTKARIQALRQELLYALSKLRSVESLRATESLLAAARGIRDGTDQLPGVSGDTPETASPEELVRRPALTAFSAGFRRRSADERRALLSSERFWAESADIRGSIKQLRFRVQQQALQARTLQTRLVRWEQMRPGSPGLKPESVVLLLSYPNRPGDAETEAERAALAERLQRRLNEHGKGIAVRRGESEDHKRLWIPHLAGGDAPLLDSSCRLSLYWSPLLSLLFSVTPEPEEDAVLFVPTERDRSTSAAGLERLARLATAEHDAVALASRGENRQRWIATGPIAVRCAALQQLRGRISPRVQTRRIERLIPRAEEDDKVSVEVREYRVTPTAILEAARKPAVLQESAEEET